MSDDVLISQEGLKIGYIPGCDCTPLEYMQRTPVNTKLFPKGFRQMIRVHASEASKQLESGGKVYGYMDRHIIEAKF